MRTVYVTVASPGAVRRGTRNAGDESAMSEKT